MGENKSINKHPHDAFFKGSFSKKEITKEFLRNYLPEEILNCIDLETLENKNSEYIDKKLRKEFSDLLYQVEINGKEGYIYILFEHKSYEDQKVIFQLLRYMTKIWEEKYDSKTKRVPIIIPLVIYHGKKKFEQKTKLWDYINGIEGLPEIMKRMTPSFEYKQYDYSPESKLEIKGRAILQAVLKILKAIREKERTDLIEGFMEFVISVENEKDIQLANEIFDLGLAYITNIERNITEKELIQASLERGDVVQSLAQRLRNEGMEKEKNKIAMEMLNEGLSYEMIQRITKLSMEKIEELKKHIKN